NLSENAQKSSRQSLYYDQRCASPLSEAPDFIRSIGVDKFRDVLIGDIRFVDDGETGTDSGRDRVAGQMRIGCHHAEVANFGRMLAIARSTRPELILSTIVVGASKATTRILPVWPACCTPFAAPRAEKRLAPKTPSRSEL